MKKGFSLHKLAYYMVHGKAIEEEDEMDDRTEEEKELDEIWNAWEDKADAKRKYNE